jgi:hypothetical protein
MINIAANIKPCPYRLELIASLERILCFCHTGSAKVFATSLMHPLSLSRGAIFDSFPMLHNIFEQPTILSTMNNSFRIDARKWPLTNSYPAIASKKAQIFSYSLSHFMVSYLIIVAILPTPFPNFHLPTCESTKVRL